jgi:hypothetical protein
MRGLLARDHNRSSRAHPVTPSSRATKIERRAMATVDEGFVMRVALLHDKYALASIRYRAVRLLYRR